MIKPSCFWKLLSTEGTFSNVADKSNRLHASEGKAAVALEWILLADCISKGDLMCLLDPFSLFICFNPWSALSDRMQSTTFDADPISTLSWKQITNIIVHTYSSIITSLNQLDFRLHNLHSSNRTCICKTCHLYNLPFQDQKLRKLEVLVLLLQPESSGRFQSTGRQAKAGNPR